MGSCLPPRPPRPPREGSDRPSMALSSSMSKSPPLSPISIPSFLSVSNVNTVHTNQGNYALRLIPLSRSSRAFLSCSLARSFSCWICLPYFLRSRCFLASSDFLIPPLHVVSLVSECRRCHSRLVHESRPDTLHVLVRLDHLGVVVIRSSERDIKLFSQRARFWYGVKCEFVAKYMSANVRFVVAARTMPFHAEDLCTSAWAQSFWKCD